MAVTIAHLRTTSMGTAMEIECEVVRVPEGEMRHVFVALPTHVKIADPPSGSAPG